MRGVSEEATGYWVVRLHTERRLLTLYFLAIRNLRNFEFATKDEAIVDAPWVRLCASYYGIAAVLRKITHIHTTRGDSTIARSVAMAVSGPRIAEWAGCGSRFSFYTT